MVGAGHHVRAKTNTPVIGILLQPIPSEDFDDSALWKQEFDRVKQTVFDRMKKDNVNLEIEDVFPSNQFIEATHVKYLEQAGARVVPIDYTLPEEAVNKQLSQINGLYIPGDSKSLISHGNLEYTKAIQRMLKWAQLHNRAESQHFPVLGVGYGALALMKSQMMSDIHLSDFKPKNKMQLNLAQEPEHTYIFDEYKKEDLEATLDKIKFFTDVEMGLTMEDFVLEHNQLSSLFIPVGTFDDSSKPNQNKEYVAALEGVVEPWFGVVYRVDKMQFSLESQARDHTDHSREAILHAQKIANLFVDEARLSGNEYPFVSTEQDAIAKI